MKFFSGLTLVLIVAACCPCLEAVVLSGSAQHAPPTPNFDWSRMNFGLNGVETDFMWLDRFAVNDAYDSEEGQDLFSRDSLQPFGPLTLSPAATVLNYGQVLFEGLKAYRHADGKIALFRPLLNAERMNQGAKRFLLPTVPNDVFLTAVEAVVRNNAQWVPPFQQGALYIRPMLFGSGARLGAKPSNEVTFCVYCSPVGNYFQGDLKPIQLQAVRGYSRAAPGGTGSVKTSGNYAPAFEVQKQVRERGFNEVLCLDAKTGEAIEEAGGSNFFAVFPNRTIVTPSLEDGTILGGVTRRSVLELAASEYGYAAIEGRLTLSDLENACEAFCCGTAAVITPVAQVNIHDPSDPKNTKTIAFGDRDVGKITRKLYDSLVAIQNGIDEELVGKYRCWLHFVDPK